MLSFPLPIRCSMLFLLFLIFYPFFLPPLSSFEDLFISFIAYFQYSYKANYNTHILLLQICDLHQPESSRRCRRPRFCPVAGSNDPFDPLRPDVPSANFYQSAGNDPHHIVEEAVSPDTDGQKAFRHLLYLWSSLQPRFVRLQFYRL